MWPQPVRTWVRNRLSRLRQWWATPVAPVPLDDLTPYAVIFDLPACTAVPNIRAGQFKGMLYWESIGGIPKNVDRILTVWRDRPAYDSAATGFLQKTGLPAPAWVGYHRETVSGKKWWKRLPWAWITAAATVVASFLVNIETIFDHVGSAFAEPQFEAVDMAQPYNILVGNDIDKFDAHFVNVRQSVGDCTFALEQAVADNPAGLAVYPLSQNHFPGVKPTEEKKVTITYRGLLPGRYTVRLKGKVRAGWWLFAHEQSFEHPVGTVRVWDILGFERKSIEVYDGGTRCRIEFEAAPGRDTENEVVEASLVGEKGFRFKAVLFDGVQGWRELLPDDTLPAVTWDLPKLTAMRTQTFYLLMSSVAGSRSPEEWDRISKNIKFEKSKKPNLRSEHP